MRPTVSILLLLPMFGLATAAPAAERTFGEARAVMMKGLKAKDPGDRSQAVYALDGFDSPAAVRALSRYVVSRDDRAQVIRAGIQLLSGMKTEEALAALAAEARVGSVRKRARILEALGRGGREAALDPLLVGAYDENPRVRVAALLGLEDQKSGRADLAISDAVSAKEWPVRSAAIHLVRRRRSKTAIPGLIERLRPGVEGGRLLADAHHALVKITGQNIGLSFLSWKRWYEKEIEKKDTGDIPVIGAKAPLPTVSLAGVETWAHRILFVLAINQSMLAQIQIDPEKIAPEDVKREGGAELARWTSVKTKMDLARLWLGRAIDRMHPDTEFSVITYGTSVNAVFGGFVRATPGNRKKAVSRVKGLSPSGNADLHRALMKIYEFVSRDPLDDASLLGGPETVYFISDGAAGEGEIKDAFRAFEEAERLNRFRQIRFHAIGVGSHDSRVIADLAGMVPGGAYVAIP